MSIGPETLRILRRLIVTVGAEADAVTRELTQAWARSWDQLSGDYRAGIQDATTMAATTGQWPRPWEMARIERLRQAALASEDALVKLGDRAGITIADAAGNVITADADIEPRLIASQLPAAQQAEAAVRFAANVLPTALDVIVSRTQSSIVSNLRPLSSDAAEAMRRELVRGVAVGTNPVRAADRMMARVQGAFEGGLTRAVTIARTEMLDAYRTTSLYSHSANADVVSGWQWWATMDKRTCPACWSMHGKTFPVSQPGPWDHQQGRCARIPKTKSWAELGIDIPEPDDVMPDAQATFWKLPPAQRMQIMGPRRLELLRSGRIQWDDLATPRIAPNWRTSYVPRTVGDLERVAARRRAAGLRPAPHPAAPDMPASVKTPPPPPRGVSFDARVADAATEFEALRAVPAGVGKARGRVALSAAQRDALREYQGAFVYQGVNGALRRGGDIPPALGRIIRNIDAGMDRSQLTDDVIVYRGITDVRRVLGEAADGDLTGVEWVERGFLSTSASRQVARGFTYPGTEAPAPASMRILVPRGTRALEVGGGGQDEILIARGARLRIVRDLGSTNGVRHLDVELVPPRAARMAPARAAPAGKLTDAQRAAAGVPGGIRPALLQGRTADDVATLFTVEYRRITGRTIMVDLPPRASVQTAREHFEGILRGAEEFPAVELKRVTWFDDAASAAYAQADWATGTLEFNKFYITTAGRAGYLRALRTGVDTGWGPAGTENPVSTAIHEFGHLLHLQHLARTVDSELWDVVDDYARTITRPGADTKIARELAAQLGVSGYAKTNLAELVAEAFTDAMLNGRDAKFLSREILIVLHRAYHAQVTASLGLATRAGVVPRLAARAAPPASDLSKMTVPQLKTLAAAQGVRITSKMRKADIIVALRAGPGVVADVPLSRMTVPQLRAMAKDRGITVPARAKKADLIAAIQRGPIAPAEVPLAKMTVAQLRTLAATRGVKLAGKDTKAAIIAKLERPQVVSQRQAGSDIELEARRDYKRDLEPLRQDHSYGDAALTGLTRKQQGWDQPARVVTPEALDAAVEAGWIQLWRGVGDAQFAEQTRTGKWTLGGGIYGNGMYTSTRRTTAEVYRGAILRDHLHTGDAGWGPNDEWMLGFQYGAEGGLLRIALDPDARIIDFKDLQAEHRRWLAQLPTATADDRAWHQPAQDESWLAVLRGYDVVRVRGMPGVNDGTPYPRGVANDHEADQYIILNRSVLMMEEASDRYDT